MTEKSILKPGHEKIFKNEDSSLVKPKKCLSIVEIVILQGVGFNKPVLMANLIRPARFLVPVFCIMF